MSEFFKAKQPKPPIPTEIRCYYTDEGRVTHLEYRKVNVVEENYIVVTTDEYDAAMSKAQDYEVQDGKLIYSPPKRVLWYHKQIDLSINPYIFLT